VLAHERFASFYREEYLRTVLYLLQNGASEADAKDAAQEAMIQAYKRWDQIVVSHRAWVRKAAYSCYLRQKEKVHRETPVVEPVPPRDCHASPADDHSEEEQLRIVALLRRLPAQQRQVAALFYDGMSLAEIANVVDKPIATVRSNLRYARIRLREMVRSESTRTGGDTVADDSL
jgi:RNA polymerase sigma factor (sigma-70 family)